jgi:hypothetical protein
MMRFSVWCSACALSVALAGSARAETFFSDSFPYADGELTINDGTGDNVSGGRWQPHSGETFDDNLSVVGGQVEVLNSGSEDANRLANRTMGAGETWYYAAQFTVNDTRADPNTEAINNDYFLHFKDDTTSGFVGRLWLVNPNTPSTTTYTLQVSSTSGNQGTAQWASDLNFGQQYVAVVSYSINTGSANLWIDPVDMSSTSINHTAGAGALIQVESLALRQDFISPGVPNNQVLVNAVAMGDDFDTVLENATNGSNIPEPGSLALVLIGVTAWTASRRPRR